MLVHSTLLRSSVNGPGERAVIWFQGCDLRCHGCFNLATHPFDRNRDKPIDEVAEWIFGCHGIEGVTFSGGEPFQQAEDLRRLCEYIKLRRPSLSIGVFSGYTVHDLIHGRWHWRDLNSEAWIQGNRAAFEAIKQFLDFGVFGRFRQTMACTDKPLCGSRNQEVIFFTDRYSLADLPQQGFEVTVIGNDGNVIITGFPPAGL
jgi:anaerobic ribonucleoside-triphosphate reductase activating protein